MYFDSSQQNTSYIVTNVRFTIIIHGIRSYGASYSYKHVNPDQVKFLQQGLRIEDRAKHWIFMPYTSIDKIEMIEEE